MNGVSNLMLAGKTDVGEIAFIDLKAQQRRIRQRIEARLQAALDHARYIAAPEIEELEARRLMAASRIGFSTKHIQQIHNSSRSCSCCQHVVCLAKKSLATITPVASCWLLHESQAARALSQSVGRSRRRA